MRFTVFPAAALALCLLAPAARAQDEDDGEPIIGEQTAYETEESTSSQDASPTSNPEPEARPYSGPKGGSSGGIPVWGRPSDEPETVPDLRCLAKPDNPSRHRPPKAKPFPKASNQYRHWFNSGLAEGVDCCNSAKYAERSMVWACRRMNRALANSAGCPYNKPDATPPPPGGVGVNLQNDIPPDIQARIAKIQQTACEGLAKLAETDSGREENCDAAYQVYRDYIDFVDAALWFKGKFHKRCRSGAAPGDKYPDLPPPPPAR